MRHQQSRDKFRERGYRPRDMSTDTYALKRRVIGFVYEAKNLIGDKFERVNVVIGDSPPGNLGAAFTGKKAIFIAARVAETASDDDLRSTVFHELVHAITGFRHDDTCPLMAPVHTHAPRDQITAAFVSYF